MRKSWLAFVAGALCLGMFLAMAVTPAGAQVGTTLYSFNSFTVDGLYPQGGLIQDASGNLYGTTATGGANSAGTVFELVKFSNYAERVLYSFAGGTADGSQPRGNLTIDASGNLFGTTFYGGANGAGVGFELLASGTFTEKLLYSFGSSSSDGANPTGGLIMDASGDIRVSLEKQ